jgi:DNA-binding transcriptional LysR family regulator
MILNDRILRLILVLADELHFGRTAARLHLSQPALSGIVKTLERNPGVRIFKRTSRSVQLTGAGHVLVLEAQHLLEEAERALTLIRASSSEILGPIRIGYLSSINLQWLATLIARARHADFAAAQFQFIGVEASALGEQLAKRTLQGAIVTGRPAYPDCESTASSRPEMVKRSCTPPSAAPLGVFTNRTSLTGPVDVINAGIVFFAPAFVATAICGLVAGDDPPAAGNA